MSVGLVATSAGVIGMVGNGCSIRGEWCLYLIYLIKTTAALGEDWLNHIGRVERDCTLLEKKETHEH
jgi:hypothetical protein